MYHITIYDNQNKKTITIDKAKKFDIIKNIINLLKNKNTNANNIKIFLSYQNN